MQENNKKYIFGWDFIAVQKYIVGENPVYAKGFWDDMDPPKTYRLGSLCSGIFIGQ